MKVLVIDPSKRGPSGLDFVMRAQRDGHDVRWYVPFNPKTEHVGEGLAKVVREYKPSLRWADLIVHTDNTAHLRETDVLRREGKPVIGATHDTAAWELDRTFGMQILREHGIEVPSYEEFQGYDPAIAYVKKHDKVFVSKPSGDADKALSYVAKTPADLVYMLERWKKGATGKPPFILQEKIEGIEMAVGGWFGPGGFNEGWCENFEFKKLCNGDLGCATGEQGTVLRYTKTSKLANKVLKPLEETLSEAGYTGYIDVNCIIDENGKPWPLEFTVRMGWPTFNIQQELHEGDCVQWLMDLTEGIDSHSLIVDQVALGVVLSIPDYPYSHITRKEVCGVPIYGVTDDLWEHIHPCEMMQCVAPDEKSFKPVDMPATAGDYVLVMSATGESVKTAKDTAYRRLKTLIVPNSPMYRTDIGDRLSKQLPLLQSMGYAKGINYRTPPEPSPESPTKPSPSSKNSLTTGPRVGEMQIIYV